jgi:hypothetical protein
MFPPSALPHIYAAACVPAKVAVWPRLPLMAYK